MADLLPTAGHIPLPYVMGYDTRPLLTLPEKAKFLTEAAKNNYYLMLERRAQRNHHGREHRERRSFERSFFVQ
jgi:hypothetical protein